MLGGKGPQAKLFDSKVYSPSIQISKESGENSSKIKN